MQQFPFFDLFKSALHVSGDVFAHLQEQFYSIYGFGTMGRPAAPVGSRSAYFTKAVYTVKLLLKLGENIARNI
jgi:O-glycosyl hydrolase